MHRILEVVWFGNGGTVRLSRKASAREARDGWVAGARAASIAIYAYRSSITD